MSLKTVDGREGAGDISQPVDNFRAELTGAKEASVDAVRFLRNAVQKATSESLPTLLLKLDGVEDEPKAMQNTVAKAGESFGAPRGPRGLSDERFGEQVRNTVDNMREVAVAAASPSENGMETVEQAAPQQAAKPEFDLILV